MAIVPEVVHQLVKKFRDGYDGYVSKNSHYNETKARVQFINPFFEALGWDVNNSKGALPAFQEVWREDAIQIKGSEAATDHEIDKHVYELYGLTEEACGERSRTEIKIVEGAG